MFRGKFQGVAYKLACLHLQLSSKSVIQKNIMHGNDARLKLLSNLQLADLKFSDELD